MAEESIGHGVGGGVPHTNEVSYRLMTHILKWLTALDIVAVFALLALLVNDANPLRWLPGLIIAFVLVPLLGDLYRRSVAIDVRIHEES